MVVGMAVDYAVHFTHFYNEADGNRFEKAQGALHGVGVSVVGGAVTTAGAALPLIFAPNFQFFHQAAPLSSCSTLRTLCVCYLRIRGGICMTEARCAHDGHARMMHTTLVHHG